MFKDKTTVVNGIPTIILMPFWQTWVLHFLGRCGSLCGICYDDACKAYEKRKKEKSK